MLKKPSPHQTKLEMVSIESLVPPDSLLRKIDAVIDFSFIHDRVAGLYCADNGRPAIDPVMMFKALFVGYLFGIRSERQLVREIELNVAYRWFLGPGLTDKVFDASTLSQNRRRRYNDVQIAQDIFDAIVEQAIELDLVDGTVLYTDSRHLKASANKNKWDRNDVERSRADYWDDLDRAIDEDRALNGKAPLKVRDPGPVKKEAMVSSTDPEAGYMARVGKPKGFHFLDNRTVEGKQGIITDSHATPGDVHDCVPYLGRLDRQRFRFGLDVREVGLDAGYDSAGIAKGLEERNIFGVTGRKRAPSPKPGMLPKQAFVYEADSDGYRCPEGQLLAHKTTNRKGYRIYKSDPALCSTCRLRASCIGNARGHRTISRHLWQDARERSDEHRKSDRGKAIYKLRRETVEQSFADAKQLHGHRYARFRRLNLVKIQCLLAAAAQNIKKMAMVLTPAPA